MSTSKIDSKDEIGEMLASINQLADDLQNVVIGTMNQIAAGDVSANIEVRNPEDEIARASNEQASEIVSVNRFNQLELFYSRTPDKKGCRLKNLSWI
ncbi:MAG: HAMP domain-containing protein [Acetobacterium sp.]|nr:HAMP domain-containing protein [Acetobacterium sp.]